MDSDAEKQSAAKAIVLEPGWITGRIAESIGWGRCDWEKRTEVNLFPEAG